MTQSCTVLIGSAEMLPHLKDRTGGDPGDLLQFTDVDALRALEAITERRPAVVAIEKEFAATPRGSALINRIKADPTLTQCEIRIVSPTAEPVKVTKGKPTDPPTPAAPAAPLDQRGTRRAPRFRIPGQVEILVDGNLAMLVDLSTIGAQVLSPTVLKPNQRVRMALSDEHGSVRFNASVAWASFEIPKNTAPRYRAGIEFLDADKAAVNAYLARHKQA
ncbi:MAG: PilZ domain-containing protein [Vicinamibacterales bacterium]